MNDSFHLGPLLQRALGGDPGAAAELLAKLRGWIRLEASILLGPELRARIDASDIAQDVCLRIHQAFAQFQGQTVPELLGWVAVIVRNAVASAGVYHGRQARDVGRDVSGDRLFAALAADTTSPEERAERDEQSARLAAALGELPAHMQELIQQRFFEGLPFPEMARRMGRSAGSLRILCVRAIRQLRQKMEARP